MGRIVKDTSESSGVSGAEKIVQQAYIPRVHVTNGYLER